jgi:type IV pilus assembly protein PilB
MSNARAVPRVLGQLLIAAGAVDAEQLEAALAEQRRTRARIGEVLVRRGVDGEAVARALAAQLRLPYAAPPLAPTADALRQVDGALAAKLRVVPLSLGERTVRMAMADPLDAAAIDDLQFRTGRRIEPVVATVAAVEAALAAYDAPAVDAILGRMPVRVAGRAGDDVGALRKASEAAPIVELVALMLARAAQQRASDIHVEPADGGLRVRVRVDGVLRPLLELPQQAGGAVVSRLKVIADLDIAVKRRPQDGRGVLRVDGRDVGLRVSTLPSQGGEKVVIRILDGGGAAPTFDALGMEPAVRTRFERLLGRSHGVLLVTGPTGSGKTTTLYAALSSLDRERRNLITLEDPVEYRLPGLTQVQVHRKAGLGFGAALRAVLRQDPDVIMVGELRDRETVETALAAALTGHLVLSTLHTNDAPAAATRLAEMGAAPYLVAGGLIGVLAQRLARRLCDRCRRPGPADPARLAALGLPVVPVTIAEAVGCAACDGAGYRGRTGIYELLAVDARVRALILKRAPAHTIREAARRQGLRTLGQGAWERVRAGITTLDEVAPLLGLLADETPLCPGCGGDVRASFRMCPACGHHLRRRCGCGAPLEEQWCRCPACGATAARG